MRQLKILVVDDSLVMRKQLAKEIENLGHTVIDMATNGQEAVDKYTQCQPDIVTMDITMPIMDGIEASRKIREINGSAKIIMVTSHDQQELVKNALELGAMGYILKPVDPDSLRDNFDLIERML